MNNLTKHFQLRSNANGVFRSTWLKYQSLDDALVPSAKMY